MSAGARGLLLLQDFILDEKMVHYNRERIPERVVGISREKRDLIVNRQLCRFFRADPRLGAAVANGPGANVDDVMQSMGQHQQH